MPTLPKFGSVGIESADFSDRIQKKSGIVRIYFNFMCKLGVSRDTVRRYQRMSEKEFEGLVSSEILRRKRKLEAFEDFINLHSRNNS